MNNSMVASRDLALVGAGYWGKNLARNFNALGALHTLCDPNASVLSSYGLEYADVKKVAGFDDLLCDPEIRKVAIAAPAVLHYKLARACIEAGKDVYVEKPLCLNIDEAEELVRLANIHGRILMVGHLLQYHPCVLKIRELIANGDLGRVQYITSNRLNLGKIRHEENALWSFAPHDISVILSLVGNVLPEEVRSLGGAYLTPQVADTTLTTLRFQGNVRAHVYVSWLNPFKEQKLTVVGSGGMAVFDDTKPWAEKLVVHRDYLTWAGGRTPTPTKSGGTAVAVPENEPLRNECSHFLECCHTRAHPHTDGEEGLRVLRVLKAAQASLEKDGERVVAANASKPEYFAHPTAVIDPGAVIGSGTKIWHFSHVMSGAELGANCNLGQNVVVSPGVKIGRNVKVQNNVSIYTGTQIDDDVFLGPSCVLTNVTNPRSEINRHALYEGTHIQRGATIGANATIVCSTNIGKFAFVAAGSVVTKDVPDYALVMGNPARRKGWMSRHGQRLKCSNAEGIMICPESGLRYQEVSQDTLKCIDLDAEHPLPRGMSTGTLRYRELQ